MCTWRGTWREFPLGIRKTWLWNPRYSSKNLACATDETKLRLSPPTKKRRNPCSGSPPVYQDLSKRRDWPASNAIVDLPIRLKGNSKRDSDNSLSLLEAKNKDLGAASQTLPTGVKLRQQRRLKESGIPLTIGVQNPSSTDKDWNPVPGIRNPRRGVENPTLSWIPLHGAIHSSYNTT